MKLSFAKKLIASYLFVAAVTLLTIGVIFKDVPHLSVSILKTSLAAFPIAFLVGWIVLTKIREPLRDLLSSTGVETRDELGELARTYSDMAARIEEKVKDLSRERTQLGAILSSLIESIVAIDHQGRLLFLNPAAKNLFGLTSDDIRGRPFLEVLRHVPLNDVLNQALVERQAVKKEILLHSPAEHIVSVHALAVDYGQGQTGVLAALHDITELRKLESVRREFVANVSHELKTPLTSIRGYVETLLDGAVDDPKHNKAFLQTIQEHTNNLSRLIDDVLDLSAIEADRVDYRFEMLNIKEVADRIVKALEPMAKAKKVALEADLSGTLPKVRADREKLAQIMMNLIDNAIKFNKTGGEVRLTAEPNGTHLQVRVKDTGRGIAAVDLPRVFERFYRGNKDRSHEIPGTGLGLAIVKHLVEAHQGAVSVQSTPGQGSIFEFTLPLG
jgi:two-component system phosphate regulon sensor histidine kinase PhoR